MVSRLICQFLPSIGGYENFHSQYPELCTEMKTVEPTGIEPERLIASHCEKLGSHLKPDYDQVWKRKPAAASSFWPTAIAAASPLVADYCHGCQQALQEKR